MKTRVHHQFTNKVNDKNMIDVKKWKLVKIYHCGGYIVPKADVLEMVKGNAKNHALVVASTSKKFLTLQGSTEIAGFFMVLQHIVKNYTKHETIAVAKNMSIFGI